jgi:hypothetical protein
MKELFWKTEKRKLDDLKPASYNPRKSSEKEKENLHKSLDKFNVVDPIIINLDNTIIGGHFRYRVLKEKGVTEIDVRVPDRQLTLPEEKELNIRLNKNNGTWDNNLLIDFDKDLLFDVGFEKKELEKIFKFDFKVEEENEIQEDEVGYNEIIQFREDTFFDSDNEWQIPSLRSDKLADVIPVDTWVKGEEIKENSLFLYNSNKFPDDVKSGILGFYVDDYRFEMAWRDAVGFVRKLHNHKWAAIITPDFSVWRNYPLVLQMYNIYKARWCARYWQEVGFNIIPSLNWSDKRTYQFCLAGIPENCPVVSVQCRTIKGKELLEYFITGLNHAIEKLKPQKVVIYGGTYKKEILEKHLTKQTEYFYLAPWTKKFDKKGGD